MRITRLTALLLLPACAWITDQEYQELEDRCGECDDPGLVLYPDVDGDGFGDAMSPTTCPEGEGYLSDGSDCDDADPDVHPGADERCNLRDDDCDGELDEDDALDAERWYRDEDGDGHGDPETWSMACQQPEGFVDEGDADDCDDGDAAVNPEAEEICGDGQDNDCDDDPDEAGCRMDGDHDWDQGQAVFFGESDEGLGQTAAGGQDLMGTSQLDLAVGVHGWDGQASDGGGVLIYSGPTIAGEMLVEEASVVLSGATPGLRAGFRVASMGENSGNGVPWLAVGCAPTDGSPSAVLFLRGPFASDVDDLEGAADGRMESVAVTDELGASISGGLDATGDGLPELVIGAPGALGYAGEAYLFHGPVVSFEDVDTADGRIEGATSGDSLGGSVALVPDVDGDGLADLLVGAKSAGEDHEGEVLLFLSPLDKGISRGAAEERYQLEDDWAMLHKVATAGDVDGDGHGDMLLGAPGYGGDQSGAVYVMPGNTNPAATLDHAVASILGSVSGGGLGMAVSGLEDFDGDGRGDILLGAPLADPVGANSGRACLFHGPLEGVLASADADAAVLGPRSGAYAGAFVGDAGDIDGDGLSDLLIGAPMGIPGELVLFLGKGW
jgi:hypothetical protein